MATIELTTNITESLESLAAMQQEGFSVMRSAHIGNARAYNLALAEQGVSMLLVDHTVTGVDKNYRPEMIIQGSTMRQVAEIGSLAFRTMALDTEGSPYLDQLHTNSMQSAFPNTSIETNISYLRRNERIAGEVVSIAAAEMPELFTRFVEKDALTASELGSDVDINQIGILQLADDPRSDRGVLIPNEVDILINFVIEQLDSQRDRQFHISGPDMVRYMTQQKSRYDTRTPLEIINTLYNVLRQRVSFGSKLPEVMDVQLVTGESIRFATTIQRSAALDELLSGVMVAKEDQAMRKSERGDFFRSPDSKDDDKRRIFLENAKQVQDQRAQNMVALIEPCVDIFVEPNQAPYLSQYDVIAEGGLYVPESIKTMSMYALKALLKDIDNLRKGKP